MTRWLPLSALLSLVVSAGCSSVDSEGEQNAGQAGSVAQTGSVPTESGSGGATMASTAEVVPPPAPVADEGAPPSLIDDLSLVAEPVEKESCAGTALEPETLVRSTPVTMYLMLDNSESMGESPVNGVTKWDHAVSAFTQFVQDPLSTGINLGLQYFHPPAPPGAEEEWAAEVVLLEATDPKEHMRQLRRGFRWRPDKCDGTGHARSAITVGMLPDVAGEIVQSLEAEGPAHATPTVGALTGGTEFCKQYQLEHPGEQCVLVFVTDGQPNGCDLDLECEPGFTPNRKNQCVDPLAEGVLVPLAQEAHDQAGVLTYTVGMEGVIQDGFDLLDRIAAAGGADCTPNEPGKEACDVTQGGAESLLEALNRIRDIVVQKVPVPCVWNVPPPPDGKRLDPNLVNVDLEIQGVELELLQVASNADCGADGGWYYDDPMNPTELRTCRATCDAIGAAAESVRVDVSFGCATRRHVVK